MAGTHTGILTNAIPLTAEQIKVLEQRAFEEDKVFVYLDESNNICFTGEISPELIKDLAWHNVNELVETSEILTKNVYKKQSQKTFYLNQTLQKETYPDPWISMYLRCDVKTELNSANGTTYYITTDYFNTAANTAGGITYTIGGN
jgi:hypothetical protein